MSEIKNKGWFKPFVSTPVVHTHSLSHTHTHTHTYTGLLYICTFPFIDDISKHSLGISRH